MRWTSLHRQNTYTYIHMHTHEQREMNELILKAEMRIEKADGMRQRLKPGAKVMARYYDDDVEYEVCYVRYVHVVEYEVRCSKHTHY